MDVLAPMDLLVPGTPIHQDNCAREPIHMPGSVQPTGVVLCARVHDGVVVQTSANTRELFGLLPNEVRGRSLSELVDDGAVEALELRARTTATPNLRPVRLSITAHGSAEPAAVDAFTYSPHEDLIVVELEFARTDATPRFEAFQDQVTASLAALRESRDVQSLLETAARVIKGLSGFDRVWVYRFEADDHGVIVAEEKEQWVAPFLGLHYPEGDIPAQARALFLLNGLRFIPDVNYKPVALEPVVNPVTNEWLDLSSGVLRGVSPMHVQYLTNMGVRASMSIALAVDGRLWGLISAHHYSGARHVPHAVRAACEFVGLITSMQLADRAERDFFDYRLELELRQRLLLEQVAVSDSIVDGLLADCQALLGVCGAHGVAVRVNGAVSVLGRTPPVETIGCLLDDLAQRRDDAEVFVTDRLGEVFPAYRGIAADAAGIIAVALSRVHGNYVVWFRQEWPHVVTWGHSDAPVVREEDGTMRLAPRESFEKWKQTVEGRSEPWLSVEIDAVKGLRSALGTFLLSRAEQLAELNARLAGANAELDAFAYAAAHDLKEPLRGIYSQASFLAEDYGDVLDDEGRARLQSIVRLADRMSALLDSLMDYATVGRVELARESCDLATLVAEAAELLASRLAQANAQLVVAPDLPLVAVDKQRMVEVFANLISNATKYAGPNPPVIEVSVCRIAESGSGRARVGPISEIEPEPVVVCVADNGIGIDPEYHEDIFQIFRRLHGTHEHGGGAGAGLTIARRIIERHGGTIWVESEPGRGSRFYFTVDA